MQVFVQRQLFAGNFHYDFANATYSVLQYWLHTPTPCPRLEWAVTGAWRRPAHAIESAAHTAHSGSEA